MDEKEALREMLRTRFRYYCMSELDREEKNTLADKLADDLITHEWETLKPRLQYWEAQAFYGSKEMWEMLGRAKQRIGEAIFDIHPLPDAIVHALLDAGTRIKRGE